MLPVERQNRIKMLMQEREHMKISELSQELAVSEMTIHRDLKPLINQGFVIKTFGGVTISQQHTSQQTPSPKACIICQRHINERLAYRMIFPNNKIEIACCAHCGLIRHRQQADHISQAICYDFLKNTTINAPVSWYVMDTSIHIGCCQPQVLTFELKEDAEKFTKGFGGDIYTFDEALQTVHDKMHQPCCHHKQQDETK